MRRFAFIAIGLAFASLGMAITPMQRMAAYHAATIEAKPLLREEAYLAAVEARNQVQLAYDRFNRGIAEMRKRNATTEERRVFAKVVRDGVELRSAEGVWNILTAKERSLMTRLAMKSIGVESLKFDEAAQLVGLSSRQQARINAQYDSRIENLNKLAKIEFTAFYKAMNSAKTAATQAALQAEYKMNSDAHAANAERSKAQLDQSVLASLTPAQRKRWKELTTLPRS